MKKKISIIMLCILFAFYSLYTGNMPKSYLLANAETRKVEFSPSTSVVMGSVRSYMLSKDTNPDFSSIWNLFDLMRSGLDVPATYQNTFYQNNINYLNNNNWQITKNRYTDYSKLILALTSMGKNAQNLEGHNLFYYLSDFTNVKKQGFNGPIWALIALKSHPTYQIPTNKNATEQTTEEGLISYLLGREISGGGWALSGESADTDITGMTIQALAPYYGKRQDVTSAIDRAVNWLSSAQLSSGGYGTMGIETSESAAQVIVALSALGIDCTADERFIKSGNSPMNGLYQYYLSEGGFMHVLSGAASNGGTSGEIDGLATEQGMYATIAYQRLLDGKTSLYDMSDVTVLPEGIAEEQSSTPSTATTESSSQTTQKKNSTTTITVQASKISLNYSQISVTKGSKKTLSATVLPSNTSNKSVSWKSANTKVATVSSSGVVKGVKAGTTTVTVTTKDGSNIKATCKVVVTNSSTSSTTKASGQTKSLTSTRKNSTTTSSTTSKKSTQSGSGSKSENESEATTQTAWSFDGEDYVPETYEVATEEENTEVIDVGDTENVDRNGTTDSWANKTITLTIPVGAISYILLGMVILGVVEVVVWQIRKRRKNHENK